MNESTAALFRVSGRVQGVGFRPFVYRLARGLGLNGWIKNDSIGVLIRAEGEPTALARFETALTAEAPPASLVESIARTGTLSEGCLDFKVVPHEQPGPISARIPPDLATCLTCLQEVNDRNNRRYGYAFTNCTDCGPRLSIIQAMPYDRPRTSLSGFTMCPDCAREYKEPGDRRFHAQPIACERCGPRPILLDRDAGTVAEGRDAIRLAAASLNRGSLVVLKGLGGFQLLARADLPEAVARVRLAKARDRKPLAVMVRDLASAEKLGRVGEAEKRFLNSPSNPIVLLDARPDNAVLAEVAPGLGRIGLFLPTTPLHALLLEDVGGPLIVTSANEGDSPTLIEDGDALAFTSEHADFLLTHGRPIVRRVDDSVIRLIDNRPVTLRAARGIAPLPLHALESRFRDVPPILAVGGGQKVAIALWNGTQAVLGPHLGDSDSEQFMTEFERSVVDFTSLYGMNPTAIAHDLHPDYPTTRWAEATGLPLVSVQHHHAHAVSAMIEHNLIDEEAIAVTWDGTGFGTDGTIWGGEILRARLDGFERLARLRRFPMLGGEAAIRQPRRLSLALLAEALGDSVVLADRELLDQLRFSQREAETLLRMKHKQINVPLTSSVGRLFDAVAALMPEMDDPSYEGEAAVLLEAAAEPIEDDERYRIVIEPGPIPSGDPRPLFTAVLRDVRSEVPIGRIAAGFHHALARWAGDVVRSVPGLPVVLTGGCFQNKLLTESTLATIRGQGRRVFGPGTIPPGDGGLAAGQLAVALCRRSRFAPSGEFRCVSAFPG